MLGLDNSWDSDLFSMGPFSVLFLPVDPKASFANGIVKVPSQCPWFYPPAPYLQAEGRYPIQTPYQPRSPESLPLL